MTTDVGKMPRPEGITRLHNLENDWGTAGYGLRGGLDSDTWCLDGYILVLGICMTSLACQE